jgi:LacI family transcriptional regulator, galactose operon repressor
LTIVPVSDILSETFSISFANRTGVAVEGTGGIRISSSSAPTSPESRVTIGDVAAKAGVSIATVSRVMNGRYGVSDATIERVREVIDELGYESSLIARSLRSQRTNVIGILVSGIEPFSAELLKGAATALQDTDFELIVYSGGMSGREGWEKRYLSRLGGTLTDGIVLVTPTVVEVNVAHPMVAVDPHVGGEQMPIIDSENFAGAVAAVEHLISLGHRRIGFLAGRRDLVSARRREEGYEAALEAAGIPYDPDIVDVGSFTAAAATAPARRLLQLDDRPTAIFAANDLSAGEVIRTAHELGLSVPDDVSVVGFDNIPESALTDPPLTTIDQSIQAMGQAAVETLIDLIERPERQGERPAHRTLPTHLIVRKSAAAPTLAGGRRP